MKSLLLALILTTFAISANAESTLEDAKKANKNKNYTEAIKIFKELALTGDAKAQFLLGYIYEKGQRVEVDYAEAAKWYRLSANNGNTDAQALLGIMYLEGRGVTKNYDEAVKLLNSNKRASEAYKSKQQTQ